MRGWSLWLRLESRAVSVDGTRELRQHPLQGVGYLGSKGVAIVAAYGSGARVIPWIEDQARAYMSSFRYPRHLCHTDIQKLCESRSSCKH